jgi:DNA primase
MAFKLLNFKNIECIAPDSENTMLTEKQIEYYKKRYELITVLFDNDVAGKESSKKYNQQYDLPIISFEVEKDLAECIKQHGIDNTKVFLKPILKIASNEFKANRKTI